MIVFSFFVVVLSKAFCESDPYTVLYFTISF